MDAAAGDYTSVLEIYDEDSDDSVSDTARAGILVSRAKLYTALSEAYEEGSEGWNASLELAKDDYEEAVSLDGERADIYISSAGVSRTLGDAEEAVYLLRKAESIAGPVTVIEDEIEDIEEEQAGWLW